MLWRREGLKSPVAVETATEEYRIESDPVGRFLQEQCDLAPGASVRRTSLRAAFISWSDQEGDKYPANPQNFAKRLQEAGIVKGATEGQRTWKGVALTPQE